MAIFAQIIGFDFNFPAEYLRAALVLSLLTVWMLVGLFFYLNHYTRRRYFTLWSAAWLFYSLWLTLCIAIKDDGKMPLIEMIKHWCVSASAVCLFWGSSVFHNLKPRQMLFGLFMVFLFVWSYVGSIFFENPLSVQVPIFSIIGAASLMTAWAFYRFRLRREYIGAGLLSVGFGFWGAYLASYPFLNQMSQTTGSVFLISAVLQLFIAVSMIILVLEEVRSSNKLAFQQLRSQKSERAVLQRKVASTEERYRRMFDQAHEGIVIVSAQDLSVIELNQTARQIFGIKALAADRPTTLTDYLQAPAECEPIPANGPEWNSWAGRHHLLNIVRADGSATPVELDGARIDFEGRVAYQFFLRELTERTRLEQRLRQAERLSAVGQMISGVAHELNNPLAVIMGYLELVMQRHELSPQTRADLQKVAQESNRAAKLVSNFLSFAREHQGQCQPVDLNEIIRRVTDLHEPEFRVTGVDLRLDLDPQLPETMANADQVQQVLVNLINNAVHAMINCPPGRLTICTAIAGQVLKVRVMDSGPGVPVAVRGKVFEPFFTTKDVGTGTGLGLSIAHSIMAEHKGRISYEDAPGGGACFVLDFPLVELPAGARKPVTNFESRLEAKPNPAPAAQTARILVLDDEVAIAEMLSEMLQILGHETKVCHSGAEALAELDHREYDLVLSDFRMPGMDGREFYTAATQRHGNIRNRIVFLTGDVVNEQTQGFLRSTGAPYLGKPFHLDKVEEAINRVLSAGVPIAAN